MTTINQRRQALAQLIQERLDVLSESKTPSQIAKELGYKSERAIHLYAAGETFVPLDHAIPLARALELDPVPRRPRMLYAVARRAPHHVPVGDDSLCE